MIQARKLEAEKQSKEQKDLIRFNAWLQAEGIYDLAATLIAASEMVVRHRALPRPQMRVLR